MFARQHIDRGTIVFLWPVTDRQRIVDEEEVVELEATNQIVFETSVRLAGRYFVISEVGLEDDEYVNHSSDPNVLCHMGIGFALRNIESGEKITMDYRLLSPTSQLGEEVPDHEFGWSARESLIRTTRILLEQLESLPDWKGG